jgi:lipopolysaccharide transport system permease protein
VVQFGLYLSPVGFTSAFAAPHVLPEGWRLLYWLNPMAGIIDGFRWSLLGGAHQLYLPGLLLSAAIICVILLSGVRYFRRTEQTFADII